MMHFRDSESLEVRLNSDFRTFFFTFWEDFDSVTGLNVLFVYFTVTDFAKFLGISGSRLHSSAM
jgi:hypothetical protein